MRFFTENERTLSTKKKKTLDDERNYYLKKKNNKARVSIGQQEKRTEIM